MYKVGICGHFGFGKTLLNGQTVKTQIITSELENQIGGENIKKIDTHGGAVQIIKAVLSAAVSMFTCRNLIILPAHNGVRVFGPVLGFLRKISRCRLHYVVIGGWLPQLLSDKPLLARSLKHFDGIYVETSTMGKQLEQQGFENIILMPNCKKLNVLPETELVYHRSGEYPLCTFSRIVEQKGIEDAVKAVHTVNERLGRIVYSLDIYGPVGPEYQERFSQIQENWPDYIRYRGSVPADQSVEILNQYFALLFPTRFYTEGVPGTIIDAYAAGVPVICSRWDSYDDVVNDGTGFGYAFGDVEDLERKLLEIADDPGIVLSKKTNCLRSAEDFLPENVLETIIKRMEI